ncbi:MAG: hypothetical protein J6X18_00480 [Bacteroidales bacterium]|nr:hypothetical protein [Bacteroidales bacterium]
MRVTTDNIENIEYYAGCNYPVSTCQSILHILVDDLERCNKKFEGIVARMYIDYVDSHTSYSPERVDPCPDYYGCFQLRWEDDPSETVGTIMTLLEMDTVLCAICEISERIRK